MKSHKILTKQKQERFQVEKKTVRNSTLFDKIFWK